MYGYIFHDNFFLFYEKLCRFVQVFATDVLKFSSSKKLTGLYFKLNQHTRDASIIFTMTASFPVNWPEVTRTTRPRSTNRVKTLLEEHK